MNKLFTFLSTPKGLIIAGVIILALVILISYNWNTIKAWFSSDGSTQRATAECYKCCTTSGISCPRCDCTTNSPK